MEINLTHSDNMTTVTVTEASTIAAITAAMRSVERRIAAKADYLMTVAAAANRQEDAEVYYLLRAYAGLLAQQLREQAEKDGARVWVSEWTAELMPRDIGCPGKTIKYLVPGRPWPRAQRGDTVEIDGRHYVVVVNAATKKTGHECQFGIYVVEPCTGVLVRGAGHGFDADADETVV